MGLGRVLISRIEQRPNSVKDDFRNWDFMGPCTCRHDKRDHDHCGCTYARCKCPGYWGVRRR